MTNTKIPDAFSGPLSEKMWWPFATIPTERQTARHIAEIAFLSVATDAGCRAYAEKSDVGATGENGRECLLIYRGKQRTELRLWANDKPVSAQLFFSLKELESFKDAVAVALKWLQATG